MKNGRSDERSASSGEVAWCQADIKPRPVQSGPLGQWACSDDEVNLATILPPTKLINETTLLPERDLSTFLVFFQEVNKLVVMN
jgi:hypothetical protein